MSGIGARLRTVELFESLAAEMNAHPERYHVLGEAEMDLVLVMEGDEPFCVRLVFDGMRCESVVAVQPDEVHLSDFRLVGAASAWEAMFDDILANNRATGLQTINSLALLGDDIALIGEDPMGIDKFSRFNQTLQEFFDGAALCGAPATA